MALVLAPIGLICFYAIALIVIVCIHVMIRDVSSVQFSDCNIVDESEQWLQSYSHLQRSVRPKWHFSSYVSLIYIVVLLTLKILVIPVNGREVRLTVIYWTCAFALYLSTQIGSGPHMMACLLPQESEPNMAL